MGSGGGLEAVLAEALGEMETVAWDFFPDPDRAIDDIAAHVAAALAAHIEAVAGAAREAVAEALSVADGEMTAYTPTACEDHNRWSWHGDGHSEAMRDHYRTAADAAMAAFIEAVTG